MKRILAGLLVVVGIITAIIGVGTGTWWKPDEEITAVAEPQGSSGMVVTDPGVLELVNNEVAVVARAEGHQVEMVVARSSLIDTWLDSRPVARITGLSSWRELAFTETEGEPAPSSIAGSDLFNPENQIAGQDAVQLRFEVPEGDWSILAVTDSGVTPAIELTWHRSISTPWMIPLMIVGLLLAATGGAILLHEYQLSEISKKRASANERAKRRENADVTETTTMKAIGVDTPADRSAATGGAFGAGIVPASVNADEIRGADLAEEDRVVLQTEDVDVIEEDTAGVLVPDDDPEVEDVAPDTDDRGDDQGDVTEVEDSEPGVAHDADKLEQTTDNETGSNDWRNLWGFGSKEER